MDCSEGVYLCTRADGKLFNITHLQSITKVIKALIHEMLFLSDAALTSLTKAGLKQLVDHLSHSSKEFGLIISLKKTNIMAEDAKCPPKHHH